MKNFETLGIMAEKDQEVYLLPLSNLKSAQSGKNGWGTVSIAVPNEVIAKLLNGPYFVGGLLLANAEQYNAIKENGGEDD